MLKKNSKQYFILILYISFLGLSNKVPQIGYPKQQKFIDLQSED